MRIFIIIATFIIGTACSSSPSSRAINKEYIPSYSIISIQINNKIKCIASIRIPEKITEKQLEVIAEKIRAEINPKSDHVYLFFLLPEMQDGNGAWAAADFDPNLKIRILGQSKVDERKITQNIHQIKDNFIGLWTDNENKGDIIYGIREDKINGLILEIISASNYKASELYTSLKMMKRNGKIMFQDLDTRDQYYLFEQNGDLSAYDNNGFIVTYKKIK